MTFLIPKIQFSYLLFIEDFVFFFSYSTFLGASVLSTNQVPIDLSTPDIFVDLVWNFFNLSFIFKLKIFPYEFLYGSFDNPLIYSSFPIVHCSQLRGGKRILKSHWILMIGIPLH